MKWIIIFLGLICQNGFSATFDLECENTPCFPSEKAESISQLFQFKSCEGPIDDRSPCNYFLAEALELLYGVKDFSTGNQNSPYKTANDIARFVKDNPDKWEALGKAEQQKNLNRAAELANQGKAVIAVKSSTTIGHVAIILPGTLEMSGSWKLKVPCSASFFLDKPLKSYVGCKLSYAFTKPKEVLLYVRK